MSIFDYQPGELSLLLNPSSAPDVYQPPAQVSHVESRGGFKRPLDVTEKAERRSKRTKTSAAAPLSPPAGRPTKGKRTVAQLPPPAADSDSDSGAAAEEVEEDELGDAEDADVTGEDAAAENDEDEEEDLSDLSDVDSSALYDDLDASTARQLRREQRRRDDEESERVPSRSSTRRPVSLPPAADPRLPRTLFVGNVSVECSRKALLRLFKEYGAIESARFRSFAVDDPKLPKKAAIIRHAFHPQRRTMNAYIVFEEEAAVTRALEANGTTFLDHTLRVDYADRSKAAASSASPSTPALSDPRQTLFVGNLPFSASEEALRGVFAAAGALRCVRLVRDPVMNVGKGFGFLVYEEEAAVKRALAMRGVVFEGRVLRLSRGLDEEKLKRLREARERERAKQDGLVGAARRVAAKEKHAKRKLEAAASVRAKTGRSEVGRFAAPTFAGERSDPAEFLRKQRRLEKKKQRREEGKRKVSMVRSTSGKRKTLPLAGNKAVSGKVAKAG